MKVKFYGVRGSLPVCGKEFERYGGNTTCFCVTRETADRLFIIDAGTGIRNLGKDLIANKWQQEIINITFTHFHMDHMQGFPFFAPAYNPRQRIGIHVMGKERHIKNVKDIFSTQLQQEYFPVDLDSMGAHFEFPSLGDEETFFGAHVIAVPQYHKFKGGSYGLRIQDDSGTLVVCTDVEHINGLDNDIIKLASGADLLIHDGQYTEEEYKKYKGWGHSTWKQAIEVAIRANVKKLIITHHDPDHDDEFLDRMEEESKKLLANCEFAKEGMEVIV